MSKNYTINGNELNCFITYSDIKTRLFQNYNNQYGYHGYFDIFTDKQLTSYECEKVGDLIKRCFNDYDKDIENSENEKQQLISFLEDKIKKCDVIMQMSIDSLNDKFADKKDEENVRRTLKITIRECEIEIKAFQEVLDFVNEGSKDE